MTISSAFTEVLVLRSLEDLLEGGAIVYWKAIQTILCRAMYRVTYWYQIQGDDEISESLLSSPPVASSASLQQAELQPCFWRVSLLQQGKWKLLTAADTKAWPQLCVNIEQVLL